MKSLNIGSLKNSSKPKSKFWWADSANINKYITLKILPSSLMYLLRINNRNISDLRLEYDWNNVFLFVLAPKSVPLEIIAWFFSPDPANFSASYKPWVEFPSVWESPEKIKNLNLIKSARNRNRAKRKCHKSFFPFHFLGLKNVPNCSQLNSAPGNQTLFFLI